MKELLVVILLAGFNMNHSIASGEHNLEEHSENEEHDHEKHSGEKHDHGEHSDNDGHNHAGKENEHSDHHGHDHGGGKAIGKGKAIVEVDEKKGFKLSKEAIKTLKLKLKTVDGYQFEITKTTLVASKNTKGVYRFRGGFFKLLPAQIIKENSQGYVVKVSGVDFGDQIVINGTGLLRVSDIYSTDKSEYGHSH